MSSTQGASACMRHPCRHRSDDRPGIPILRSILPCDAGSTAHATVQACSEKDAATLAPQSLENQDYDRSGTSRLPGDHNTHEQHEDTRHTTARHQHRRLNPPRPTHRICASGPRIADRLIWAWATASRVNQARLFSDHQSDHNGDMS